MAGGGWQEVGGKWWVAGGGWSVVGGRWWVVGGGWSRRREVVELRLQGGRTLRIVRRALARRGGVLALHVQE